MADILDIISASPDIFDNWTRHLRCIANADQCQAVSVTVFEASRSPQALRDAFWFSGTMQPVYVELVDIQAKLICKPEHREAICRYLIEHDVQVRRPRYIIVADEFVEMVHGVISTIRRKERIKLKKLEQVTIPVSTFDHPTQCSLQ